jgi:hypothetical protein
MASASKQVEHLLGLLDTLRLSQYLVVYFDDCVAPEDEAIRIAARYGASLFEGETAYVVYGRFLMTRLLI